MSNSHKKLSTQDFDYNLPEELIALEPEAKRDASRLLIVSASENVFSDTRFTEVVNYLEDGDLLVLNDTKVFPARLFAVKDTGGKVEILAERVLSESLVKVQIKSSRSPKIGQRILLNKQAFFEVVEREDEFFLLKIYSNLSAFELFEKFGKIPLPPYIQREQSHQDKDRYQTVYAENTGAVAAPTAGLHFTQSLLEELKSKGITIATITLHVGAGTFKPVKVEDPAQHKMHNEYAHVSESVCAKIKSTKLRGKKVVAVGTTCVRALESAAHNRNLSEFAAETNIFIYPGFKFNVIDALITNFHLPRSTLMMLVSALAGTEKIMAAYQHAINQRYRFYSYGDAMLIFKK